MEQSKVFAMPFARVYPLLVNKAERKGRTKDEVDTVICWLTGYSREALVSQVEKGVSYAEFFGDAPALHPNAQLIKGKVCGVQVDAVEDPLMWKIRCLDKLVDELAKGRPMEKVLR